MWSQNLPPHKTLPYYSYSNKKKEQLAKLSRYKLFILLLSRFTYRIIKQSISHLHKITSRQKFLFQKICQVFNRTKSTVQSVCLQKLKKNVLNSRRRETILKNMGVLVQRMMKYKMKKSFSTIFLYAHRKNKSLVTNIENMRKIIFCRKIHKIFTSKKKQNFNKIYEYSLLRKRTQKKLKVVNLIGNQYIKKVKQACFNLLAKHYYNTKPETTTEQSLSSEILQQRIIDMQSQLQAKNASINQLQQQISQLRLQQTSNNYNSFSQYSNTLYPSMYTRRNNSVSKSRRSQTQSIDSGLDFSIGSILGNSFSLSKSRSKSTRKDDSAVVGCCSCSYKQMYIKMKNTSESLKNQLQIVKQQLEVAKDLNDHFTNQIRQYFGGDKDSLELERLKKEVEDLRKDKQELRIKVFKYQNHITTLKSQFKLKIQQLYRKVKKQR